MDNDPSKWLPYKRSNFVTHLPVACLYSPSHYWAARLEQDTWRVGMTKFATRMLGEMVEHGFNLEPDAPVQPGQVIGWVEGFKAISDIFCIASGRFGGGNPELKQKITLINEDPYRAGWLYAVKGQPDATCMDVNTYRDLLDKTIDRLLAQQKE